MCYQKKKKKANKNHKKINNNNKKSTTTTKSKNKNKKKQQKIQVKQQQQQTNKQTNKHHPNKLSASKCSINLRCQADTTKESQTVHAEAENTLSATQSAVLNSKMPDRYDKENQRTHGEVRPCHLLHRCAALNSRCQADTARRIKPLTVKTMETSGVRCSTWM